MCSRFGDGLILPDGLAQRHPWRQGRWGSGAGASASAQGQVLAAVALPTRVRGSHSHVLRCPRLNRPPRLIRDLVDAIDRTNGAGRGRELGRRGECFPVGVAVDFDDLGQDPCRDEVPTPRRRGAPPRRH